MHEPQNDHQPDEGMRDELEGWLLALLVPSGCTSQLSFPGYPNLPASHPSSSLPEVPQRCHDSSGGHLRCQWRLLKGCDQSPGRPTLANVILLQLPALPPDCGHRSPPAPTLLSPPHPACDSLQEVSCEGQGLIFQAEQSGGGGPLPWTSRSTDYSLLPS